MGGGGSGGRGIEMGTLRFSMAEVGRGGKESTVDAIPGTRMVTHVTLFGCRVARDTRVTYIVLILISNSRPTPLVRIPILLLLTSNWLAKCSFCRLKTSSPSYS